MAATPEQKRLAAEVAAELRAEGKLPVERPLRVVTGKSEAEPSPPADDTPPVNNFEAFEGCPDGADLEQALDLEQDAAQEIAPFETFNALQWEGVPIEPRRWLVADQIPLGEPGIMSGDGGTGKTKLALQLAVAITAGLQDWAGFVVDAEGPAIVFSAEEKLKEMHRRTNDILQRRGLSFADLHGGLHFICDPDDEVLGRPDIRGIVQPTLSLLRLERTIVKLRPAFVMIENAADVYGGNENDRTSVTRFVRKILGRLTVPCDSTMMLIQHPSVSGLNDGSGRSGSTGWNNSGRWRNNFTKPKDETDKHIRQLEICKNNYGPDDAKVRLRWDRGVFIPDGHGSAIERSAAESEIDHLYLKLLDTVTAQRRKVSPTTCSTYAPSVFEAMPAADGCKSRAFAAAQERLFARGAIAIEETGPPSKRRSHVVRAPLTLCED